MAAVAVQKPTHEEIAVCAYLIWEKEGRPHGRDQEHWSQAEAQLMATHIQEATMAKTATETAKRATAPTPTPAETKARKTRSKSRWQPWQERIN
jgi:hypothetical protein